MADTAPSVKKYYDFAQQQVDEQALLDKFNAATTAQFNLQREQNRQAENQFYNQMYNTQQTAMDTIRQSNAAAVSTGASRGVQAAQELSALLGLQQESVASATELANANRQTAQEETAAVLENVLNAYQQAEQQRQNLVTAGIQAASVDVESEANKIQDEYNKAQLAIQEQQAQTERDKYLLDLKVNDPDKYYQEIAKDNNASNFTEMTEEQYNTNIQNATAALEEIASQLGYNWNDFADWDTGEKGEDKSKKIQTSLRNLYSEYGLSTEQADTVIKEVTNIAKKANTGTGFKKRNAAMNQAALDYIQSQFKLHYAAKYATTQED